MERNILDRLKAAVLSLLHHYGFGNKEPVERRVESARMTCNRLKALEIPASVKPGGGIGLAVPFVDVDDPAAVIPHIKSRAAMSHFRLASLAAVLPEQLLNAANNEDVPHVDDDQFVDPKQRRAQELAAKYC